MTIELKNAGTRSGQVLHLRSEKQDAKAGRPPRSPLDMVAHWANSGIVLSALLIGLMSYLTLQTTQQAEKNFNWVVHTQAVQKTLQSAQGNAIDTVSAGRGFALTGEDAFLDAQSRAERHLSRDLESLRQLTADNADQQNRLRVLEAQVKASLHSTMEIEASRERTGEVPSDTAFLESKRNLDVLRTTLFEMQDQEATLLDQRMANAEKARLFVRIIVALGALLGTTVLGLSGFLLRREVDRGTRTQAELQIANVDLERQSLASRRAEEESRRSELRFLGAAESSMDALYFCEALRNAKGEIEEFIFTYVNSNAINLVTYPRERLIGGRMCELFPMNRTLGLFEKYKHTVLTGEPFVGEFPISEETIHTQWLRVQAVKLGDGVAVSASDITPRKRQEEALRKSEALLRRTEQLTESGGWEVDWLSGEVFWSTELFHILGVSPDYRPTLETGIAFYIPEDRPRIRAVIENAAAGGDPWDMECTIVRPDGRQVPVRVIGAAEFENGKPVRLTGAMKDISQRVTERRALETVTHRLRLATDSGGIGIWDWDLVHDRVSWDPWMFRLYGMEPREEDVVYEVWRRHVHPDDVEEAERETQDALAGVRIFNTAFRVVWDDGQIRFLRVTAQVTRDDAGRAVRMVGANWDVTAQKQSELELAKLANFTQSIITSSPFATIVTDLQGVITSVNPAADRMSGYRREELINLQTPLVFLSPQEVVSRAIALSEELQTAIEPGIEVLTANPRRGRLDEAHWQMIRQDGSRFVAQLTVTALTDSRDSVIGYILIAYDITEQQLAEKRTLQALEEKEVLLKEVHHRVKNNLQIICGLLGLQAASVNDPKSEHALLDSHNRVHSMAMIHEMLYGSETLRDIDFESYARVLVEELLTSYRVEPQRICASFSVIPMRLSIDRAVPCGLILNELISNSLKYAFPGDRAGEISVSLAPSGEDRCEILVEDTGVGLPDGFSVEHSDSLGLRLVAILVKQLGGEYAFSSNQGTRFRMSFPL